MVEQVDRDAAESFYEGPCTRGLLETILSSHRIAAEARAMEKAAKIVDQCNRDGPYNAIGAAKLIRAAQNGEEA